VRKTLLLFGSLVIGLSLSTSCKNNQPAPAPNAQSQEQQPCPTPLPDQVIGHYRIRVINVGLKIQAKKVHLEYHAIIGEESPISKVNLWVLPGENKSEHLEFLYFPVLEYVQFHFSTKPEAPTQEVAAFCGKACLNRERLKNVKMKDERAGNYIVIHNDEFQKEIKDLFTLANTEVIPRVLSGQPVPQELLQRFFTNGRTDARYWDKYPFIQQVYPLMP
jgi:hypothetical protein